MGKVEENEFGDHRDSDSGDTFDDEKPSPPFDSIGIVQTTSDTTSEETTKCAGEDCGAVEDSESFAWNC